MIEIKHPPHQSPPSSSRCTSLPGTCPSSRRSSRRKRTHEGWLLWWRTLKTQRHSHIVTVWQKNDSFSEGKPKHKPRVCLERLRNISNTTHEAREECERSLQVQKWICVKINCCFTCRHGRSYCHQNHRGECVKNSG